jgi:hypothetical protein
LIQSESVAGMTVVFCTRQIGLPFSTLRLHWLPGLRSSAAFLALILVSAPLLAVESQGHHCAVMTPSTGPMVARMVDDSLPVPQDVTIMPDDRNAIIEWEYDPNDPVRPLPDGVGGYRVLWGPADDPNRFQSLTERRRIQLQPLTPGVEYWAAVQSVGWDGRVSQLSAVLDFAHDSSRVDALRATMNGFFDDFNLPEGLPDERNWNTAYSLCNKAEYNSFFINPQYHGHSTVFASNCDRAMSVQRARKPLSLADDGTRRIVFDFDGQFRRDTWYLDLLPARVDLYSHVGHTSGSPGSGLRLRQNGQNLKLEIIRTDGSLTTVASTDWSPYPPLNWAGLELISNVRRHWEMRLSRTAAELFVDGQLVLATEPDALDLQYDEYWLYWMTFSYNTAKANHAHVLTHWDNVGFDAPPGLAEPPVVHNYRLLNGGSDLVQTSRDYAPIGVNGVSLNIPDAVTGALARRLMFTLQMWDFQAYAWDPADRIVINGQPFALPQPTGYAIDPSPPPEQLISSLAPHTVTLELPDGVLQQGDNDIVFDLAMAGVHGIHAEFDFAADSAPPYTSPAEHASGPSVPSVVRIGPSLQVQRIHDETIETWRGGLDSPDTFNPTLSGLVEVEVFADNEVALAGNGMNHGVVAMGLVIDGELIELRNTAATAPAPSSRQVFVLDTTTLDNGLHQLFAFACNQLGDASMNDYGSFNHESGQYFPLHFTSQNAGRPDGDFVSSDFDSAAACQAIVGAQSETLFDDRFESAGNR